MEDEAESAAGVPCRHCGDPHPATFSHCPKTGHSLTSGRALVGRVIANRYRVLALLDEGGMGAVYVAEHLLIGRKVALKRLHPELSGDEKAVARFQREARAAGATGHEHIVEVLDLGYADDGAPYLVMEYLRGKTLARLLEDSRGLGTARACRIVGQILDALAAVHAEGIVHRDLKPDNVFLIRRQGDPDFVKIVDFGISKVQPAEGETRLDLTRTGVMLGTPFYMSPEQARGVKDLDHRVDLFATGVILYELLTGTLPFDGENYHQLLQAILSGTHEPVGARRPDLDPELARIVERAIAKQPEDRYQTAAEMRLALEPFGAVAPEATTGERRAAPRRPSQPPISGVRWARAATPGAEATRGPDAPEVSWLADTTPSPREPTRPDRDTPPRERRTEPGVERPPPGPIARSGKPRGLVPRPLSMSGPPRAYLARSSSWPREGTPRVGEPLSALRAEAPRELASARSTPRAATSDVKGALVLAVLELLRRESPDRMRRVSEQLGPETASRIESVLLPMAWVPLSDFVALLRSAERQRPGDGQTPILLGRHAAERELASTHRLFMQSATPTVAVERIPKLFRAYHSSAKATADRSTAGGYRIRVVELDPDTLCHALFMSGFYQRLIELTGGQDVRAHVVSCKERGDDATATVLRWR